MDLHPEAQVGTVDAVAVHRLLPGHPREGRADAPARQRGRAVEDLLDHRDHVARVDERHLEVDLRELGLAVGAQVLVAEAARDLVVALDPADHQQLLEELRALRQRVELSGVDPRRDEVVARPLGRRLGQDRGLDLPEPLAVQDSRIARSSRSGSPARLHPLAPNVEIAPRQSRFLARNLHAGRLHGQVVRLGQHRQRRRPDLDPARRHLRIDVLRRARDDDPSISRQVSAAASRPARATRPTRGRRRPARSRSDRARRRRPAHRNRGAGASSR